MWSRAAVILSGGREPSHWQFGPNMQFLHTCGMLPCCDNGGCWKSRVTPLGDGDEKDRSLCVFPTETQSGQVIAKCMDRQRLEICDTCDQRRRGRCLKCGCRLRLKARGRAFKCLLGKWPKV